MTTIPNITLTRNGETVTIYTEKVEDISTKAITVINIGQGSAKKDEAPKEAKIIDLQKFERRFAIRGSIDNSAANLLKAMIRLGGEVFMEFDSDADGSIADSSQFGGEIIVRETQIPLIIDKGTVTQDANREDDHQSVELTGIEGDPL